MNEKDLDYITDRLNDPKNHRASIRIAKTPPIETNLAQPIDSPLEASFKVLEFDRKLLPEPSYRWWVDMAFSRDTGEPVVIVTHQGDVREWTKEAHA